MGRQWCHSSLLNGNPDSNSCQQDHPLECGCLSFLTDSSSAHRCGMLPHWTGGLELPVLEAISASGRIWTLNEMREIADSDRSDRPTDGIPGKITRLWAQTRFCAPGRERNKQDLTYPGTRGREGAEGRRFPYPVRSEGAYVDNTTSSRQRNKTRPDECRSTPAAENPSGAGGLFADADRQRPRRTFPAFGFSSSSEPCNA